ncbi:hypothetical protein [Anaerococcus degeneri]|uniref:N-acetyltransferase domain-containing protein n=1 Tax=Anaerococcus degeneri TaxID=361500 RepID=A0ABS7YW75_9FIRM|nr:hypothetical protein [Anaerococcus degeneri]MBP2015626.1 hypothetical protein [Anaerococcus degeneri]MCA2095987.1 hypothetical protein [Anaerococcus degeneri]
MQIRPLQRPDLAKVRPLLDLAISDKTHFSYPRFYKINDIFRELEYSIEFMATESLVIEENGNLEGLATYFWDEDEKYIQTTLIVIKNKDIKVFEDLISQIKKDFKDYSLNVGLSHTCWLNEEEDFKDKAQLIEHSHVLEAKNLRERLGDTAGIRILSKEDFLQYEAFHDKFSGNMYYNSKNLLRDFDRFRVFVKENQGEIVASLLVKVYGENPCKGEIFGLFIDENEEKFVICNELLNAMVNSLIDEFGKISTIKYFVEVDKKIELERALANGFEKLDTYLYYKL